MKQIMVAALLCASSSIAFAQGGGVVLPTRKDIGAYQKEESTAGACARCGTVVSIEPLAGQKTTPAAPPLADVTLQDGHGLQPVPVLTRDARAARKEMTAPAPERFRVYIRNDDGSFSNHEIDHRPDFSKGDRVEVTLDGLQRR